MTYRTKKTTLFGIVSVIAASGVFVFATGSRFGLSSRWVTSRFLNQVQDQTPKQIGTPPARNLSLQPLAFKVGRVQKRGQACDFAILTLRSRFMQTLPHDA